MKKAYRRIAFLIFILLTACTLSCERSHSGREYAEAELKEALSGNKIDNVVDGKSFIIKDSITAIAVAEPILFEVYGKENIIDERPYEVYLIDNFWVIKGTLPKSYAGGTFLIIIDARDSKVLRITHGK